MDGWTLELPHRRATRRLGRHLAAMLAVGDRVWLDGPLGAGKTFFARGLLRGLGVPETVPVTSPTFALVHEHAGRVPILHLDLYRLSAVDELDALGLFEAMERAVTIVEWGGAYREALGGGGVVLSFERGGDTRRVHLDALDEQGANILRTLRAFGMDLRVPLRRLDRLE